MRILHICREASHGGAELQARTLIRATRARGHEVRVAAPAGDFDFDADGPPLDLPRLDRRMHKVPAVARALRQVIRDVDPDLVHCHSIGLGLALAPVTRRGRRPPTLLALHGLPRELYRRLAWPLRLSGLRIVAYGPSTAGILAGLGVACELIPNGVDPPPRPASRESVRALLGSPPDAPIVISVGRLVSQKNHRVLIRALVELPDVVLAIVGEGELLDDLRTLATELGVERRVHFLGFRGDARAVVAGADVAALPSTWEGFPLAAIEAMQAEVPLVVSDAPGLGDWLENGVMVLVVAQDDPVELASAIRRLLNDQALASRLTTAASSFARDLTIETMIERHVELYERMVVDHA